MPFGRLRCMLREQMQSHSWLFCISPTPLFTQATFCFTAFYVPVFDNNVTCGRILNADGNRLRLQTNASNCGPAEKPEMQNKYACHQDGCRRVIIWFSTERLGGGDSEDNCCLSWEHRLDSAAVKM